MEWQYRPEQIELLDLFASVAGFASLLSDEYSMTEPVDLWAFGTAPAQRKPMLSNTKKNFDLSPTT